jgi:hypothetical protein
LHSLLRMVEGTAKQNREESNNMIWLLLPVSYWPLIMIGQSGLVLVSGLFAVPVLVLWVGLGKSKQLNLDVRNIFAGSLTEHCWSCSIKFSKHIEMCSSLNCSIYFIVNYNFIVLIIYILPPFTWYKRLVKFFCIENSNVLMKCSNYHFFLIMGAMLMWH